MEHAILGDVAALLTPAEHAALEAARWRGDPLADAAAADPGVFASLANPRPESACARMLAAIDRAPGWLDDDALVHGGELVHRAGPWALVALASGSLIEGYADPRGNKPLALTGQLERRAYRRLQETARFLLLVCAPDGMRPDTGAGWRACVRVRLVHARVRALIRGSGRWNPAWGEPANIHDTVGTLMMFTVFMLEGLARLGLRVDDDEAERYYRLFRYVGHVLGIDDAVLPVDLAHARRTTATIRAHRPAPDDDSRALTRALLEAPVRGASSSAERLLGHALRAVLVDGARRVLAPELAIELGIPRMRSVLGAAAPLRMAWDHLGHHRRTRTWTIAWGRRLWDAYVDYGLRAEPPPFAAPDRLHGRVRHCQASDGSIATNPSAPTANTATNPTTAGSSGAPRRRAHSAAVTTSASTASGSIANSDPTSGGSSR